MGEPYELAVSVRGTLVNVAINGEHALAYRLPIERSPGADLAGHLRGEGGVYPSGTLPPAGAKLVAASMRRRSRGNARRAARAEVALAEKVSAAATAQLDAMRARAAADRALHQQPPADDAKVLAVKAGRGPSVSSLWPRLRRPSLGSSCKSIPRPRARTRRPTARSTRLRPPLGCGSQGTRRGERGIHAAPRGR